MSTRWRRNASDFTWLIALPLTAALLPWRWGFAVLRAVARRGWGFGDVVAAAWREAAAAGVTSDAGAFARDLRLLLLVDRTDSYLAVLHGARWWRRHLDIDGDGLAALHAGLLLNTHWGAGNWIWRLLLAEGLRVHFVVRRGGIRDVGHGRVSRWFLRWREWMLRRTGCAGPVFTGGSRDTIASLLRGGDGVLGMLDLPAGDDPRAVPVTLLGQPTRFPAGLVDLALGAGVAVSALTCGLDVTTGRRTLRAVALPVAAGRDAVLQRYAAELDRAIRAQPALWQLWPQAPLFWARD